MSSCVDVVAYPYFLKTHVTNKCEGLKTKYLPSSWF